MHRHHNNFCFNSKTKCVAIKHHHTLSENKVSFSVEKETEAFPERMTGPNLRRMHFCSYQTLSICLSSQAIITFDVRAGSYSADGFSAIYGVTDNAERTSFVSKHLKNAPKSYLIRRDIARDMHGIIPSAGSTRTTAL